MLPRQLHSPNKQRGFDPKSILNSYHAVYEVAEEFSDSDDVNDKGSRVWLDGGLILNGEDGDGLCGGINYTKKMNPTNWVYQT